MFIYLIRERHVEIIWVHIFAEILQFGEQGSRYRGDDWDLIETPWMEELYATPHAPRRVNLGIFLGDSHVVDYSNAILWDNYPSPRSLTLGDNP